MIRINLLAVDRDRPKHRVGIDVSQQVTLACGLIFVSAIALVGWQLLALRGEASTGSGLSYTWNFGDGAIVTETVPTITYAFVDDSTRNVVLTVTDIAGNTASTTVTVDPEP